MNAASIKSGLTVSVWMYAVALVKPKITLIPAEANLDALIK